MLVNKMQVKDKKPPSRASRLSKEQEYNTLEFRHKPDCPLHELEAFEA